MPNIKRRFADDDPSSDDDDDEEEEEPQYYARGGGKGMRMPGGKGMGKQLRPPPQQEESEEESDDSDEDESEDEPAAPTVTYRAGPGGGGKQLRPAGGKQLRPPPQEEEEEEEESDDDDDDDDDEDEEIDEEPIRPVQRGGGKALMRMRPPEEDEDDDESDSDEDEEEEEQPPQRAVQRGGGKSLMRMPAPADDDDDDDDDDSDEEEEPEPARVVHRGGGKALSRMQPPAAPRGGGKQLRPPPQQDDDDDDDDDSDEDEEEVEKEAPQVNRVVQRGGGKSLMRAAAPSDDEDDEDSDEPEKETPQPARIVQRGGGKSLMRQTAAPSEDEDSDDDSDEPEKETPQPARVVQRGGKSLMRAAAPSDEEDSDDDDDDEDEPPPRRGAAQDKAKPKPAAAPTPAVKPAVRSGGKQLRRAPKDESSEEESDEDDMDVDSEEEKEEEEAPPAKPAEPKKRGRPRKAAAAPKPEVDSDDFDDDDSSSEEEAEWDMETFDTNKLVKDDEDQKYLDSLPEIEREAILNDRFEKRKAEHDMKKALHESKRKQREENKEKGTKKRKAPTPAKKPAPKKPKPVVKESDESDEEELPSTAGANEAGSDAEAKEEAAKKIDTAAKAQKLKALADSRKEKQKVTKKDSDESESDFGADDDDSDDDDFEDTGKTALKPWQKRAAESKTSRLDEVDFSDGDQEMVDDADEGEQMAGANAVEAELEDYQQVTLPRRRLGRWCNEPFFKDAVKNCFVKLFVGVNEQGRKCYRLCKIVGFETSKTGSYQLPPVKKEKPVSTEQMLILKFGNNQRSFPIRLVSDAKVDDSDVKQYVTATKAQRGTVLYKKQAHKLRRKQDELVNNYTYTIEDIENNLKAKKKKGQTAANLGSEQTKAAIAVQGARDALAEAKHRMNIATSENMTEAREALEDAQQLLQERLEEEKILLDKVKNRRARLTGRSKDQKWANVNRRNIIKNQKTDLGSLKPPEKSVAVGKPKFDPYARRKVKPKILWEVGQEEEKREEEPKDANGAGPAAAEEATADKGIDVTPTLVQEQQEKAAALSQSHQFAIDEEVLAQSSLTNGIAGLSSKKAARKRERKGLSLAEYQEKKSAGTL